MPLKQDVVKYLMIFLIPFFLPKVWKEKKCHSRTACNGAQTGTNQGRGGAIYKRRERQNGRRSVWKLAGESCQWDFFLTFQSGFVLFFFCVVAVFFFSYCLTFYFCPPDTKRSRGKETTGRKANPNDTARKSAAAVEPTKQNRAVSKIRLTITKQMCIFVPLQFLLQFSILLL